MEEQNKLAIFDGNNIRSVFHNGEMYFSIIDIIRILTDSKDPQRYWSVMKSRLKKDDGLDVTTICSKLKMVGADLKMYPTDAANTEGVLRLIMSVPSPKAEPFRLWMAQVGKENIDEIGDPELGFDRLKSIYEAKGYPKEWIERRMQTIEVRKQLTDEWKNRGVKEGQDYAILTAEIAKATFGLTPSEHSKLKGLDRQNLRDHMTPLELIFTALGEEATRMNTISDDAQGFQESHEAAQRGGHAAGDARLSFEKRQNQKVVSSENYLKQLDKGEEKED
jgi:DNA-damage-inducible protein D